MPSHTGGDGARVEGAWTKDLLRSTDGDSFSLLRLRRDAALTLPPSSPEGRILVLDGELAIGAPGTSRLHGAGAYFSQADGSGVISSPRGALALVLSGERLGVPADDVFGPEGWHQSGPGQWFRLLLEVTSNASFDERLVGLSWFEPGSTAPRHDHRTAHRFLFLDGEADDELLFPDGTRQTAHRARGDFVDYPYPIQHQTFSRTGCMILFAHEPLPGTP